jgi:hypothetical protein
MLFDESMLVAIEYKKYGAFPDPISREESKLRT